MGSFLETARQRFGPTREQRVVGRILRSLRATLGETVLGAELREGTVRVFVEGDTLRARSLAPLQVGGYPIVVVPGASLAASKLPYDTRRHLNDDRVLNELSMLFQRGPSPELLFRIYTVLPNDLTLLTQTQNHAVVRWLAEFPAEVLQTRVSELHRELTMLMQQDNQGAIRNALVRLHHASDALAIADKERYQVQESTISRQKALATRCENIAKSLRGRGYGTSAEEMERRAAYHTQLVSDLRKRYKRRPGGLGFVR